MLFQPDQSIIRKLSVTFNSRRFKVIILIVFVLLVLFASTTTATAGDNVLKFSAGAEYTSGNYGGTESIDELYVPLTVKYFVDRYVFRLTIPYLRVTSPTGTLLADGTILLGTGERNTESGLGDIIAAATYRDLLNSEAVSDFALDITTRIKFGTADENRGLGTGENDYTFQAELFKYFDRFTSFGILGYKFRGDPAGINLSDSWLALLGGQYKVSPLLSAGVDFYIQQASLAGVDDQKEVTAYLGYKLSKTQLLNGYFLQGFGDRAPDWGVGIMITFRQ